MEHTQSPVKVDDDRPAVGRVFPSYDPRVNYTRPIRRHGYETFVSRFHCPLPS